MKKISKLLAALLACAGALAILPGYASAAAIGPYSTRAALEEAARGGNVDAKWEISSAYANAGQLTVAWRWIDQESPGAVPERRHYKAWLAWRVGNPAQALAILPADCEAGPCHKLKANAYFDIGMAGQAVKEFELWSAQSPSSRPEALSWLLSACLIAGDFNAFDRWSAAAGWRDDPAYEPYRTQLIGLEKSRASLGARTLSR